jgi:hypothetical protein
MPSRQLGFDLELNGAAMATAFVIRQGSAVHGSAHQLLECLNVGMTPMPVPVTPAPVLLVRCARRLLAQGEEEKWET